MSEKGNCGIRDFSKYDEMTTEELEEILRLDAENTEDQESDTETLLYVMEVLTKRRMNNGHTGNTAQEAYESFKQHYMPEIDNEDPVPTTAYTAKRIAFRWVRALVATAAIFFVVIFGSVTAKAFGFDIWETLVQWTQETFHFGSWNNSNTNNNLPYATLQEALEKGGVTVPLVPARVPEGFELTDISVEHNPVKEKYRAVYTNEERVIRITVQDYLNEDPVFVEQSDGLVEEYVVSGITYYLFENNENVHAVWIVESFECYIAGPVTIDDLKMMIDSISKG